MKPDRPLYIARRWYHSKLRDGVRRVQQVHRNRVPPPRRSLPAETRILKAAPRVKCYGCGAITGTTTGTCSACWEVRKFREEQQRLRRATVIQAESHNDYVFADGYGYHDGYFESLDDLLDHCDCEGCEPPCFVHPCAPTTPPSLDADWICESIVEEQHEDFAASDLAGFEELEKAVEAFNARQTSYSWMWDSSRVIVLDHVRFDALLSEDRNGLPDVRYINRNPEPMKRKPAVEPAKEPV